MSIHKWHSRKELGIYDLWNIPYFLRGGPTRCSRAVEILDVALLRLRNIPCFLRGGFNVAAAFLSRLILKRGLSRLFFSGLVPLTLGGEIWTAIYHFWMDTVSGHI